MTHGPPDASHLYEIPSPEPDDVLKDTLAGSLNVLKRLNSDRYAQFIDRLLWLKVEGDRWSTITYDYRGPTTTRSELAAESIVRQADDHGLLEWLLEKTQALIESVEETGQPDLAGKRHLERAIGLACKVVGNLRNQAVRSGPGSICNQLDVEADAVKLVVDELQKRLDAEKLSGS